jgi:CubicO group peptidase (beta-lactamase class C family)
MSLEEYCQHNIFKSLGMASTTFRLLNHPHVAANLMKMNSRNKDGQVEETQSIYPVDPKMDLGGSNLYTSGPDFIKFLTSLMRNDGKLLRAETTDIMFDYRLPETEEFKKFKMDEYDIKDSFGEMAPEGMQVDHCLAGQVVLSDLKGGRKAGSVNWSGATRCFWVRGLYSTHRGDILMSPTVDRQDCWNLWVLWQSDHGRG